MDLVKPGARPHKAVNYICMKPWPRFNEVITSGEPAGKVALAKTLQFYVIFDFICSSCTCNSTYVFRKKKALTILHFGNVLQNILLKLTVCTYLQYSILSYTSTNVQRKERLVANQDVTYRELSLGGNNLCLL